MPTPRLLDQARERMRVKHYSLRTEEAYVHWIRRFILHHGKRHPRDLEAAEVEAFLSHLATEGRVSASTQNQALAGLLFLYREVLGVKLPWMEGIVRAKRPARLPVVLTEAEVRALLAQLDGTRWLAVSLLYSTGMRLLEGLRLRQLVLPADPLFVPLGLELSRPLLAVEVEHLVEGEPVAVWRAIQEARTGE